MIKIQLATNLTTFATGSLVVLRATALGGAIALSVGCVSPTALHRAVVAYDQSVVQAVSEELLLNIVRAAYHRPLHFTTVPSVAATFDFRATAGIIPPEGDGRGLAGPVASFSAGESPTVTILPMGGEEFTQRLLTPMDESRVTSLLATHRDLNMLLRLVVRSFRLVGREGVTTLPNDPGHPNEYAEFRRKILHLASLHRQHLITVGKETSEVVWRGWLSVQPGPADIVAGLDKDLVWSFSEPGEMILARKRIMLTNYSPSALSQEEKRELGEQFQTWPPNEILVHLHPRFPGGEIPILGTLQLRSLKDTLEFIAEDLVARREFGVTPDERTKTDAYDAPILLHIERDPDISKNPVVAVKFDGVQYALPMAVQGDPQRDWSLRVFALLYDLFQMTVKPSTVPVPGIAITK
ncbi:MAG: hypothetical protein CV090_07325 [Nitrospira sp. WS238]|nr:hypothetical protein [Nitrospira sp. WS238]